MTENVDQAAPTPTESKEQLEQALFEIRRIIAGQDAMLERVLVCLLDRKSTRLNSSHNGQSRMPSSA